MHAIGCSYNLSCTNSQPIYMKMCTKITSATSKATWWQQSLLFGNHYGTYFERFGTNKLQPPWSWPFCNEMWSCHQACEWHFLKFAQTTKLRDIFLPLLIIYIVGYFSHLTLLNTTFNMGAMYSLRLKQKLCLDIICFTKQKVRLVKILSNFFKRFGMLLEIM